MKRKKSVNAPKCPYCGKVSVLRDASFVYKDLTGSYSRLYVCTGFPECNVYVGVHNGTNLPLGTLADGGLRRKRIHAHRVFNQIWQNDIMTKKNAYRWMQDVFCLREEHAHIAQFSEYMCDELIVKCREVLGNQMVVSAC